MNWLTFDDFGTVMDLTGRAGDYLAGCDSEITGEAFLRRMAATAAH